MRSTGTLSPFLVTAGRARSDLLFRRQVITLRDPGLAVHTAR